MKRQTVQALQSPQNRIWFLSAILVAVALHCLPSQAIAQDVLYEAKEVKAAFIYHFATFVQWPETSTSDEVFEIAVLGADEVAAELEKFLPGRAIQGRPIEVRRLQSIGEVRDAAVLFIGDDQTDRLAEQVQSIEDRPCLVVTDSPGALRVGAMINFEIIDQRVRFEISLTAAERAGLAISSRLLSAAMFVDTTSAIEPPGRLVFAMSNAVSDYR